MVSSPLRGPKAPTTDFQLLANEKLRLCGGAIARVDGVLVGTYVGAGAPFNEEFLRQAAKVIALRCAQLPTAQWDAKISETTCHPEANFHFGLDREARIYIVAVDKAYPARLAFLAVEDLRAEFAKKHGARSLSCPEDGCRAGVREAVAALARRFEDVDSQDQLSRIQSNVDKVRDQMQINISQALKGMATTEEILVKSEELKASALVFKKNATKLKKLMWWQKTRYQLMVAGTVVIVLTVLIAVLVAKFK